MDLHPEIIDGLKDVCVFLITSVFVYVAKQVGTIRISIVQLNQNISVIIEKLNNHEKQIDRHEGRINSLEDKI